MKYRDDQCKKCGGVRVANSTLCASCLVRRFDAERAENLIKRTVIEALKLELAKMNTRLCAAVDYGFKKNQEFDLLLRSHKRLEDTLEEVRKDEKDGKAEDTEKGEKWESSEVRELRERRNL